MRNRGNDFKLSLSGKIVLPSQVGAGALNERAPTVRIVPRIGNLYTIRQWSLTGYLSVGRLGLSLISSAVGRSDEGLAPLAGKA